MMEIQDTLDIRRADDREGIFSQLYEDAFPKVSKFVANRGGTFDEARDIFHDALVILYEQSVKGKAIDSPEAYLVGIAKHLWIRKFNDDHERVSLTEMEQDITIPEDNFEPAEVRMTSFLELAGRKCLQLLRAFYYDSLSLDQIKSTFGFSSSHSASVQKFKCIEKLRNTIQEKSIGYEDLA